MDERFEVNALWRAYLPAAGPWDPRRIGQLVLQWWLKSPENRRPR